LRPQRPPRETALGRKTQARGGFKKGEAMKGETIIYISPAAQKILDARGQKVRVLDGYGVKRDTNRATPLTIAGLNEKLAKFWDRAGTARTRDNTLSNAPTLYTTDTQHLHALAAMNARNRDFWRGR